MACSPEREDKLSNYVDMINDKVKNNAENAERTNNITSDLLREIQESNDKMKDMLSAMDNIESASKDIENIINSINEIHCLLFFKAGSLAGFHAVLS